MGVHPTGFSQTAFFDFVGTVMLSKLYATHKLGLLKSLFCSTLLLLKISRISESNSGTSCVKTICPTSEV